MGSASAAYQIEEWMERRWKSACDKQDTFVRIPGKHIKQRPVMLAVDHYHHYKEDIALCGRDGIKTCQFSVSWARICRKEEVQSMKKDLHFIRYY